MAYKLQKNYEPGWFFAASCIIHTIIFCIIFIAIVAPDTSKLFEPLSKVPAQKLTAPVVLYSGPPPAPHKTVATPPSSSPPKTMADKKQSPQAKQPVQQKELQSTDHKAIEKQDSSRDKSENVKKTEEKKQEEKKREPKKKSPVTEKTTEKSLFSIENSTATLMNKKDVSDNYGRARSLTLSDLFKTMPHLSQSANEAAQKGDGDTLVVAQGDMKYYSFFNKFIGHMNQVFAFNDGPQKVMGWMRDGKIKKSVSISITINKTGHVLETRIVKSSGCADFDNLSVETAKKASPFPPVPAHFNHENVRVDLFSNF